MRNYIALLLGCLFCPLIAQAGIHPIPMTLTFNGETSQDFRVVNEDRKKPAYVNLQVEAYKAPDKTPAKSDAKKADSPKAPPRQEATVLDPRQSGILISPTKLVLPPGGTRLVRVRLIQPPGDVERRYVVRVAPVDGELIAAGGASKDVRAGVRVIIAYGVVVIVAPLGSKSSS